MAQTWILIDVSNLMHRAFHTTGQLSYGEIATGALYGFFRDIANLRDQFSTNNFAFCFDGGHDKRLEVFSAYKWRRREYVEESEEEKQARRDLRRQIYELRVKYLPYIGYKNIFWEEGFEADDMIASLCENKDKEDRFTIVSSDSDLYQLLSLTVKMWLPSTKKFYTVKTFQNKYGISPCQWADVKALAGCSSDNVVGIKSVGEVTASQFLAGTLKLGKRFNAIIECRDVWDRNLPLTRLPFEGTPPQTLTVPDGYMGDNWDYIMTKLGMVTLTSDRGRTSRENSRSRSSN